MAREQAPREIFADLPFPVRGLDRSLAFGRQLPLTTAQAANVRAFEALTQRGRGGSRPGLAQYIAQQLPLSYVSGSRLIQHLNTVVDPTTLNLVDSLEPDDPDPATGLSPVDDPSDAGPPESWGTTVDPATGAVTTSGTRSPGSLTGAPRKVRRGGSGRQPNKNRKRKKTPALVQSHGVNTGTTNAFAADVAAGSLVVVAVSDLELSVGNTVTVTDSQGNLYAQAGGYGRVTTTPGQEATVSLWYAFAAGGPLTVTAAGNFIVIPYRVSEWSGVQQVPALAASAAANAGPGLPDPAQAAAGALAVGGGRQLAVAAFYSPVAPPAAAWAAGTGFTLLGSGAKVLEYQINPAAGSVNPAASVNTGANSVWCAAGALFFPA